MNDDLTTAASDFLAHKRALGRKYRTEEATMRPLLAFTGQHGVTHLCQLTPGLLDEFAASRPIPRARSFNHLIGNLGCFLDWAVAQQRLDASPLRASRQRETDRRLPFLFDTARARRQRPSRRRRAGTRPSWDMIQNLHRSEQPYSASADARTGCGVHAGG